VVTDMNESRFNTVRQLRGFLDGTLEVQFCALSSDIQRYAFISAVLKRFGYAHLGRASNIFTPGVLLSSRVPSPGTSREACGVKSAQASG
jgi:hypothetical protein